MLTIHELNCFCSGKQESSLWENKGTITLKFRWCTKMSYVTVAMCNIEAASNMHDLYGICSISAFTWMRNHFIKYFFMFFILYSWWQKDSNWKPFIYHIFMIVTKRVKESHNRPDVAQRIPGGLGFQISWHSAREGGEVVSLTHRPPLPPGMFLALIFTRGWVDPRAMVRSEGNMSLKNPVTSPGIDPGTVRLVAQRLNHYATPGPDSH